MLKFLMKNALFEPARDARHMPHCAAIDTSAMSEAATIVVSSRTSLVAEGKRISGSLQQAPLPAAAL
jgi:hypothetical protein